MWEGTWGLPSFSPNILPKALESPRSQWQNGLNLSHHVFPQMKYVHTSPLLGEKSELFQRYLD